jgi:glycosyltransferase involved in cell wall biosynthesis
MSDTQTDTRPIMTNLDYTSLLFGRQALNDEQPPLRIALLGTRGVPTIYGGFERCAEQLGLRLVERGHSVTVYCRRHFVDPRLHEYKGMKLVSAPTVRNKYLDTLVHTFSGSIHALFQPYDVCLYFIAGNSLVSWIPRLAGKPTVLNVDGLDWKREKWPRPAKLYIQLAERLATSLPTVALTDSRVVQKFYKEKYNARIRYITYGSEVEPLGPGPELQKWGLEARKYILFVGRIVPENHVHHLIEAYRDLADNAGMKLVIMGDASYADDYVKKVHSLATPDTVFTGYVGGDGYRELVSNAYLFVETSSASGTHPALLEAMSLGNCVVAQDTAENIETMGGAGLTYSGERAGSGLRVTLQELIHNCTLVQEYRDRAHDHVQAHYSWDAVTEEYLALFYKILAKRGAKRSRRR